MAIIPVQWCLFGFSFAFGSLDYAVQRKAGLIAVYDEILDLFNPTSIPLLSYIAF